jgi:murein DD-endopeptidase MepM/ murein hydrolase activator NlpD
MRAGPARLLGSFVWIAACSAPAERDPEPTVDAAQAPKPTSVSEPAEPTPQAADDETTGEPAAEAQTESGDADEAAPPPDPGTGEVQEGESLSRILHRAGLDAQAVYELTKALEPKTDPTKIRAGQRYRVELADDGRLARFELHLTKIRSVAVSRGEDGKLSADVIDADTQTTIVDVGARVESSLWAAVTGSGEHPSLVSFVVDVFAYDVNFFTDTRPGDAFRVIVERIELDGEFIKYGRVLAAEYAGEMGTHRVFWFDPSEAGPRYVNDEGLGVARTLLKTPLKFSRVSSEFNPKRMHPILHRVKGHNGVDYAAPEGTPVWAAADGRITVREKRKGGGNMVILAHANGMTTLYMHLSRFADGQKRGMSVKAKTVIGYVGMTGLATGPHLHFGVKVSGRYVDPKKLKQHRGPGVPKGDKSRWKRERDKLVERLEAVPVPETPDTGDHPSSGETRPARP